MRGLSPSVDSCVLEPTGGVLSWLLGTEISLLDGGRSGTVREEVLNRDFDICIEDAGL